TAALPGAMRARAPGRALPAALRAQQVPDLEPRLPRARGSDRGPLDAIAPAADERPPADRLPRVRGVAGLIAGGIGALGQGCFALRTLLQWQAAERAGRSVAPRSFWWLSLFGALLMLIFSALRGESVLAGGYAASAWIYARNLSLRPEAAPRALSD